jgi:hypothetical protein
MSHEGYSRTSDPPPLYEYGDVRNTINSTLGGETSSRTRRSSRDGIDTSKYTPQQQKPIDEAVNSAFDNAQISNLPGISPDLIAQITQNVIQQLQLKTNTDTGAPLTAIKSTFASHQSTTNTPPPSQSQIPSSSSPRSINSPPMPKRVYTPPSPLKHPEHHDLNPDSSPKFSAYDNIARETERPASVSSIKSEDRPKAPERIATAMEETTLEKIWGTLFDEDKPTPRLGQFLRGLAVHLVSISYS